MLRYAISFRRPATLRGPDPFAEMVAQAARLAAEGVDFFQVREKDLDAGDLIGLTRRIITAVRAGGAVDAPSLRVLVNGRPDVALAAGADGVHLPSGTEQLRVGQVRQLWGERAVVVSVACHTMHEVERASGEEADLILFSPVFGKRLADGMAVEAAGLEALAAACAVAGRTPVLALGGVTLKNTPDCRNAGAAGVAGIRLFH